jgi:hypothetical protein
MQINLKKIETILFLNFFLNTMCAKEKYILKDNWVISNWVIAIDTTTKLISCRLFQKTKNVKFTLNTNHNNNSCSIDYKNNL